MEARQNTSKKIVVLTLITFFARVFGLLREILIANYYGTSMYTDAYIIANNIPTVLFETLGAALLTCFIPMYTRIKNEKNENEANHFTQNLISRLVLLCGVFIILGECFTRQVVWIFASGFKGDVLEITEQFTRILFPSLMAMMLLNVFNGYLQVHDQFNIPALTTVIGNIVIILSLVLASIKQDIFIFVWGSLIGICFQVFFVLPWVIKKGLLKSRTNVFKRNPYVKQLIPLLIPVVIGSAISEINSIVDRTMVSNLETGTVSSLNYAFKVISLIISVIVIPIVTIMYTRFSEAAAKKDTDRHQKTINDSFNLILFVIIPITIMVILFRSEIIYLLFQRGNFDSFSSTRTINALIYYAFSLVPMAIQNIIVRAFYSLQDTKTPTIVGGICAALNALLNYVLIQQMGYVGAPLATSLVACINSIILYLLMRKKMTVDQRGLLNVVVKNCVSSIPVAIILIVARKILFPASVMNAKHILLCAGTVIFSIIIYLFMQIICKNPLAIEHAQRIRDRLKPHKQ